MSWQTSSSLERVEVCPASVVLPHYPHQGPEATYGTRNHEAAERGELPARLLALTEGLANVQREIAMVLDVDARRVVRVAPSAREYGKLGRWEIGTTPDFLGEVSPGTWRVIDWKSRKLVTTPKANPQVISQVLAAFAHYGASSVEGGLGYLSADESDLAWFTAFDVPSMWDRLRSILERGHNARPDQLRTGEHCTYCPALSSCPAHRAIATTFGVDIEGEIDALPVEKVGELRAKVETFKKLVDRADEAIKARARREPIPLAGGKVLRLVDSHRTSLDQDKVKAYLADQGQDISEYTKRSEFEQVREVRIK